MKKLILAFCFLPIIGLSQIVNIPDNNFRAKLIGLGLDTNTDEQIELSEALAVSTLTVSNCNIADFTGIEAFTNLTILYCHDNPAAELHINNLVNLQELYCGYMQLTELEIGNLVNLHILYFQQNNLTHVDMTNLVNVTELGISWNPLLELDVSTMVNLQTLACSTLNITYLDVSHNPNLCLIACVDTPSLQRINMKNGVVGCFENLILYGNQNLTNVCVDDGEAFYVSNYFENNNMPDVNVNTYCSFTPGGSYNTITARVAYDADGNGCEASDPVLPLTKIIMTSGTAQSQYFTNLDGICTAYSAAGAYSVQPVFENQSWFTSTPATDDFTFADAESNAHASNFCITANGTHADVEVVIIPIVPARPGFDAVYKIVYENKGNQMHAGTVTFEFPEGRMQFVSSDPIQSDLTSAQITFSYDALYPFQSREIVVTMHVNAPVDSPAVNNGDILSLVSTINLDGVDENPSDNSFPMRQVVVGSFDPNDKLCSEGNQVSPSQIGNYLHYVINFENTGTTAAQNIVVRDDINVTQFDIASIQLVSSSHQVATRLTGTKMEFVFENIDLAPEAKGYVAFKIKTLPTLTEGSSASNKANIYFDFNAPVETNTVTTSFQTLAARTFDISDDVAVYPNPAIDFVRISANSTITAIELIDVHGRILKTADVGSGSYELSVSGLAKGIYLVRITTDLGQSLKKIIKN